MDCVDIRQSDHWSNYLKMYGWTSHKLPSGAILRTAKFPFFSVAKIQRAYCLTVDDLKEAEHIFKIHRVLYSKVSPSVDQDLHILVSFGYKRRGGIDLPPRTVFINLQQDEDTLWRNLTKDCRYCINRSCREGDRVEMVQDPNGKIVEKYYKVVNDRSQKTRFYTPSLLDHLEKVKCFGKESFICTAYSEDGRVLGAKMFLGFNGCVWYMYSGITKPGEKSCGNYQLMWECLKYFKQRGYNTLDMEGLSDNRLKRQTKRWKNYSDYKMQFGGNIVDYPLPYEKYRFPLL